MTEPSGSGTTGAGEPPLPPAPPAVELPPPPFTIDQLLENERSRFVVAGLMRKAGEMEEDRDRWKKESGRARTGEAEAKQLHERYQKAMRDAESEFREVSVALMYPGQLSNQPADLGPAIRNLARKVREIGPERDNLRNNVSGLQKEVLKLKGEVNERDTRINTLSAELRGAQHQVKLFESSAEQMQRARDHAQKERDKAKDDLAEQVETNEHLTQQLEAARARIKELEAPKEEPAEKPAA